MAKNENVSLNVGEDADVVREKGTRDKVRSELNAAHQTYQESGVPVDGAGKSQFEYDVDAALGIVTPPANLLANQEELVDRIRVLSAALEKQNRIVAEAENRASLKICAAAKPRYVGILKRMAATLKELSLLAVEERDFRESLRGGGVSFSSSIRPMPLAGRFEGSEPTAVFDAWLAEVKQYYPGVA